MAQGLRGDAVIAGFVERKPERHFSGTPRLGLEQWSDLAADALADAGIDPREVDGLCCGGDTGESAMFVPSTIAEYCGWSLSFAERVDLGGASSVGMVWRDRFLVTYSKPLHPELLARKPVSAIMDASPLIIDARLRLEQASRLVTRQSRMQATDQFIIVRDGTYAGVGHTIDLLSHITEMRIQAATHCVRVNKR